MVGSWYLLPLLAHQVKEAFEQYTGGNPSLHISAGITLEGPKFPLYQAAERADKALNGGAKQHRYAENGVPRKKNAVHLLGQTLGWDDFADVRQRADIVTRLVRDQEVPRGLLQTLQMIYNRFLEDRRDARRRGLQDERVFYGPWRWRQAYHLSRFAGSKPKRVKDKIEALQKWTLEPNRVQYLGLAARWADYLTRGKEE